MLFLNSIFVTFMSKHLKRAISNLKIVKQKKGKFKVSSNYTLKYGSNFSVTFKVIIFLKFSHLLRQKINKRAKLKLVET